MTSFTRLRIFQSNTCEIPAWLVDYFHVKNGIKNQQEDHEPLPRVASCYCLTIFSKLNDVKK
jgi:hypothetical protein